MYPKLKAAVAWGTYAYVIGLAIWLLLWLTIKDGHWLLVLVHRFAPYLFIPVPILLAPLLPLRQWKPAAALLFPALLFVTFYAPYIVPKPAIDQPTTFTVLTYNVLLSNTQYDAVARVILSQRPDLVALQEVQPEMMAELDRLLADEYPYKLMGNVHQWGTTAVFSRHPFAPPEGVFVLDLENDRPAVVVRTTIEGMPLTFIAAHLNAYGLQWHPIMDRPEIINLRTRTQNRQAEILLDFIAQEAGTVIVGCDCNSYEKSESYRMLTAVLRNSSREVGWRPFGRLRDGMQPDDGLWRIDYVLFQGELEAVGAYRLEDTGGSDHQPVLVEFYRQPVSFLDEATTP